MRTACTAGAAPPRRSSSPSGATRITTGRRSWSAPGSAAPSGATVSELDAFGDELEEAIERVRVPAYVIDREGIIRWLNPAAQAIVGDVRGRHFTSVVAPDDTRAQELFGRQIAGAERLVDSEVVLVGADGDRVSCEFSSVALTSDGDRVVGVFGQLVGHGLASTADEP